MKEWLGGLQLSKFYGALVNERCKDIASLLECSDNDIASMCDAAGMKRMQKAKFLKSLAKFRGDGREKAGAVGWRGVVGLGFEGVRVT